MTNFSRVIVAAFAVLMAGQIAASAEEPTYNIGPGMLDELKNNMKLNRDKPIVIQIPGIATFNIDISDRGPDCDDLYEDMIEDGTEKAKAEFNKSCIDKDTPRKPIEEAKPKGEVKPLQ